jgi:biotin carboxyl carrier protein
MKLRVAVADKEYDVSIEPIADRWLVSCGGKEYPIRLIARDSRLITVDVEGNRFYFGKVERNGTSWSHLQGMNHPTLVCEARHTQVAGAIRRSGRDVQASELRAPIPGLITRIMADQGEEVVQGQGLLVLMAMKMENEIGSPKAGVVKEVCVTEGSTVDKGDLLVKFE